MVNRACPVCGRAVGAEAMEGANTMNNYALHVLDHFQEPVQKDDLYSYECLVCQALISDPLYRGTKEIQRHFYSHSWEEIEAACALLELGRVK